MSQSKIELGSNSVGEYRVRMEEGSKSKLDNSSATTLNRTSQFEMNEEKAYRINGDELISASKWQNPLIQLAVPLLNVLNGQKSENIQKNRTLAHFAVSRYQNELSKRGVVASTVQYASYLLCTYADEQLQKRGRLTENFQFKPLLIEFHGDSWGGEVVYENLDSFLVKSHDNYEIIELYYLVLSLGFEGKNSLIGHGELVISELLSRLHSILYADKDARNMYFLPMDSAFTPFWLTVRRAILGALLGLGIVFALLSYWLYQYNLDVRSEIAAYEPPVRVRATTSVAEVLPDPLPKLMLEGWLTAKRVEGGWILVMKSDGAFEVGSAEINPNFKENVIILARTFRGHPGSFLITGHTDSAPISSAKFPSNMELALARAESTRAIFITESGDNENGEPRVIDIDGKGASVPVASNDNVEGRRANRRVEIFWKINDEKTENALIGKVVQ